MVNVSSTSKRSSSVYDFGDILEMQGDIVHCDVVDVDNFKFAPITGESSLYEFNF